MTVGDPGLRRLAHRIATTLADSEPTACVLLGGSLATGRADVFSDLDLYLISEHPVPQPVRRDRLRAVADPRTVPFLDQPMRTGGLSDTCKVAGRDVTICYRRAADVEQAVRALYDTPDPDPDREAAYGHELGRAEVLRDPLGLAAGWQRRLAAYPAARGQRVQDLVAGRLAAASRRPSHAVQLLGPAVAWSLHGLCARHGIWFPGSKRRPATAHWPAAARAGLVALEAALGGTSTAADRLTALAGLAGDALPDEAAVEAVLHPTALPPEQWANLGSDALGGRMQVALEREDPFAAAHYLGRAIEAMAALGEPPGPELLSGSPAAARRRLAATWRRMMRERGLLNPYVEAALRLALA